MPCQPFCLYSAMPPSTIDWNFGNFRKSPSRTSAALQKKDCMAAMDGSLSLVTRSRMLVLLCRQPKHSLLPSLISVAYRSKTLPSILLLQPTDVPWFIAQFISLDNCVQVSLKQNLYVGIV